MSRRQKNPLRQLSTEEYRWLTLISRSTSELASHVVRAKQLLAVAAGASYTEAGRVSGRKSNEAVAQLVARFNREGLKAIEPKKGTAHHRLTMQRNENEFCGKHGASQIRKRMGQQTGRS